MLARWQRYQAARALYAWRVSARDAKEERMKQDRQQAALRSCRVGFSPCHSPLAAAFEVMALGGDDRAMALLPARHASEQRGAAESYFREPPGTVNSGKPSQI